MRKINTGLKIQFLPILNEQLEQYSPCKYDWVSPVGDQKALIEYASKANKFAGVYSLFQEKRDEGYKPLLVPTRGKPALGLQLDFPNDLTKNRSSGGSHYAPRHCDWEIKTEHNCFLFGNIGLMEGTTSLRIKVIDRPVKRFLAGVNSEPLNLLSFRMYDVGLKKTDQGFVLQEWD